ARHRDYRIPHHLARLHAVIPPHEALDRMLPGRVGIELVIVGESDKSMQVNVIAAFDDATNGEAATSGNGLTVGRQPNQTSMIAVVINFYINGHSITSSGNDESTPLVRLVLYSK